VWGDEIPPLGSASVGMTGGNRAGRSNSGGSVNLRSIRPCSGQVYDLRLTISFIFLRNPSTLLRTASAKSAVIDDLLFGGEACF
jgi:hypothetical protein